MNSINAREVRLCGRSRRRGRRRPVAVQLTMTRTTMTTTIKTAKKQLDGPRALAPNHRKSPRRPQTVDSRPQTDRNQVQQTTTNEPLDVI